jgi:hypothetical protein
LTAVRRSIALAAAATIVAAVAAAVVQAAPRTAAVGRTTFTGYGFDTCGAPSLSTLGAWLASPYRAVGIYIGGVNRACPDGNLSASWVESATSGGWSLFPLYVGLQAPCVGQKNLATIDPASAAAEGTAAASDAASRAAFFGLATGVPIYFDMEGYATNDSACSHVVDQFVSAWVNQLHALGYVAGIYGSAASTMRDMVSLASSGAPAPDQIDIGNWNGNASVYGDPYVPDSDWVHHQRIHQYRGGHTETWGGVKVDIDNDYLEGAVAGVSAAPPGVGASPAGSTTSSDGDVTVTWPAGTFAATPTVDLTPSTLAKTTQGFAAGSYVLDLTVSEDGTPLSSFSSPLTLRFAQPRASLVPAFSPDGLTWTVLLHLPDQRLPASAIAGYWISSDGSITAETRTPGFFGLLRDVAGPSRPTGISGSVVKGGIVLHWAPSTDNSGVVASYRLTRGGTKEHVVPGTATTASLGPLTEARSVFRVVALDRAGNASTPSPALVVTRRPRPNAAPRTIPGWAWKLLVWQRSGRTTRRPRAPSPLPPWYWDWAAWQLQPYRISTVG